jgi:hypothetical protein
LEGADTLTTDAQAFLRRILETAAPNVEFALEVRDETTMNPPLLSRCQRICMPNVSFRKQAAIEQLEKRGYADLRKVRQQLEQRMAVWSPGFTQKEICESIVQAKSQGLLPDILLKNLLRSSPLEEQLDIYRFLGDGGSPWVLLAHVALGRVTE